MRHKDHERVGFLPRALKGVFIQLCPNTDGFHDEDGHHVGNFVINIIYGKGIVLDIPSREEVDQILEQYPDVTSHVFYGPCSYCRSQGIMGPNGYNMPEHMPPDKFEPHDNGDDSKDEEGEVFE